MSSARRREAEHILHLCLNDHLRCYEVVERQLASQTTRALVMLSFSVLIATAAGFGGRSEMSHLARICMAGSLLALLASSMAAVFWVLRVRWLSQLVDDEPLLTLLRGLELRDRRARALNATLALLLAGFSLYSAAMLGA